MVGWVGLIRMVGTHSLGGSSGDAACDDVFRWYIRMLCDDVIREGISSSIS